MANLSNINNILRTGSLGVGINRDPLGAFEISSATKPGIKMFNTAASGKTYEAYSDINGNYIIFDQDANDNRFVINSAGNATFAGMITVNGGGIDIDNNDDVRLRFDNASVFKAGLQVATTAGDMIAGSAVNDFAIRAQENMLFATGGNTERMRIDSSGLINFSKTATTATAVASINHASNNFLYINGGTEGVAIGDDNQNTRMVCYNNDYIRFDSAAVERMRLTPDGNNTFLIIKAKPATYNSKSFITLYGTNSNTYGGSVIARSSISSETDGSAYGANLKFYTNDSSNVEQTRLQISSNGFGYFYNNFYLASASNQGNLFFGTASNQYNIFGGGTYGYMGYNTGGYHRFLVNGSNRLQLEDGEMKVYSTAGLQVLRLSPNYIQTGRMPIKYPYYRIDSFKSDGSGYFWAFGHEKSDGTQSIGMMLNDGVSGNKYTRIINTLQIASFTSNEYNGAYPSFQTNVVLRNSGNSYFNGGNVGIGITSPIPKLHLSYSGGNYATDATSGFINQATTGRATQRIRSIGNTPAELFFDIDGGVAWDISARDSSAGHQLNFYGRAATPGYNSVSGPYQQFFQNGNVTIAGTLTQNSDITLKENIKPLQSQLEIVSKLNPVSYNKIGQDKNEIGFIAQEVEELLPELVLENEEGLKSLAYGNMNAILVKAIQELKTDNDSLKARIETLENN